MATNWYVDNSLANSLNKGTNWTTAWTNFASIVWNSPGVKAGDTIYISGGNTSQTYRETLTAGVAGAPGAVITISPGQDSGHNGKVIFDGQNVRTKGMSLGPYYLITGNVSGQTNLIFTNFVSSVTDRDIGGGAAIWGYSDVTLEYIEVSSAMNGFYFNINGLEAVEIRNCYLHDIRGDFALRLQGTTGTNPSNLSIHNCRIITDADFSGSNGGPDGIQITSGFTISSNYIECASGPVVAGQHPDGIQTGSGSGGKIFDNVFVNQINYAVFFDATQTGATNAAVYNNICIITHPNNTQAIALAGALTQPVNGTILANNTADGYAIPFTFRNPNSSALTNAFINCRAMNNLSVNGGSNIFDATVATGGNVSASASAAATNFISYSAGSLANNYHLRTNANLILGKGFNLSPYFRTDKDGNVRPSTNAWDVGVYQLSTNALVQTNLPPQTNAPPTQTNMPALSFTVTPTNQDYGIVTIGKTLDYTFVIKNIGTNTVSGNVNISSPFSVPSGGTFNLASGRSQNAIIRYSGQNAGSFSRNAIFGAGLAGTQTVTCVAITPVFSPSNLIETNAP
ncbi:MAG TPA: hypothetical protein VFV23_12945 [Verrucomicrobiae bacterium]|nr:hypothetical protein [Verrucomicrobiae bacterium]